MLADLFAEAGIPEGVVNIVTGGNDTGQAIVEHPDVRMVSLTGSSNTGKKIHPLRHSNTQDPPRAGLRV
jgi:betaine-aldehyde dehydrogenase